MNGVSHIPERKENGRVTKLNAGTGFRRRSGQIAVAVKTCSLNVQSNCCSMGVESR